MVRRVQTVDINVEVDIDDVLDELTDERLIEELNSRSIEAQKNNRPDNFLLELSDMMEFGRFDEAKDFLNKHLNPRWKSEHECLLSYRSEMGHATNEVRH